MKVLIIDPDKASVMNVSQCLRQNWPQVTIVSAANGEKGIEMLSKELPDLVILEIGLPEGDGFEVLSSIRSFPKDIILVIFTYKGAKEEIIKSLEKGADTYISKFVSLDELSARIKALLRRSYTPEYTPEFEKSVTYGNLVIDFDSRQISVNGKKVKLSSHEYKALRCLVENEGRVVSPGKLLRYAWGPHDEFYGRGLVKVYIRYLRKKIEDNPHKPLIIKTVRGEGYTFQRCS